MFKNDKGFKKDTNINISIKQHSVVFYSPMDNARYSICLQSC